MTENEANFKVWTGLTLHVRKVGSFRSKNKDPLTLANSFENTNQLKV